MERIGRYTLSLEKVKLDSWASVVGKKESEGPLGNEFDLTCEDDSLGQDSWEKAEATLQRKALEIALSPSFSFPPCLQRWAGLTISPGLPVQARWCLLPALPMPWSRQPWSLKARGLLPG